MGLDANGAALDAPPFEIREREGDWRDTEVVAGPRIGISRAVDYPWRFCAAGSEHLSRPTGAVASPA